ncbi:hypothetical protein B566_EDAN009675 [Ephemera danica]|nr:hypothetical protein B566_EDAN009675 [Ephemera danica]
MDPVEIAVAQVIPHPQYRPPALYHDIGLLRLARHVTFHLNMRPACLPQSSPNETARVGDIGGPLTIRDEDNECVHHVVGVTSTTSGKACGFGTSIYSRVSFYVPWIESVVWPDQ